MRPPDLTRGQRRKVLLFAAAGNGIPVFVAVAGGSQRHLALHLAGALVAVLAPMAVLLATPRRPRLRFCLALTGPPALTALQAYEGGIASAWAVLLVMPALWFGVQATRAELIGGGVTLLVCCIAPMLVLGAPAYPVAWSQALVLLLVVGSVTGSLATVSRETWQVTASLRRDARIDSLTGLLNRRGWTELAGRELARVQRHGGVTAIVGIDLDKLKVINDTLGHDAGDRTLRETSARLRSALRTQDAAARMGGDEFTVMMPATSVAQALAAVERLRSITPPQGAFSAGVAGVEPGEALEDVLRRADLALYEAKARGGGASVAADESASPDLAATSSPSTASTLTRSPGP